MYQRPLSIAILAIGGFAAASDVLALGFGRIPESIPFGQALDLTVPLRLDAGESVAPGCVQTEVHVGELRLPPGTVVVTLERRGEVREDLRVRIRSSVVVHEPLVAVNLTVGCNGSVSRQFVVFADPPDNRSDATRVATAEAPLAPASAASATAAQPVGPQPALRAQAGVSARAAGERSTANGKRPVAKKATRNAQVAASSPRVEARTKTPVLAAGAETPKRTTQAAAPRLKLEEPEELLKAATLAVAAQDAALASAAQAASAAEAAASAAEQRLLALESNLKTVSQEAAAHRATMDQMRTRLAQAEDQSRTQSVLMAIVLALGALTLWLGWRVRALQRERQAAWWQGVQGVQNAAAVENPVAADEPALAPPVGASPAPPPLEQAPQLPHHAATLPSSALGEDALIRPVSVDELIDLEQEAEFFVVLGEEESAVDLLMAHLRSTGGTSPLPYLKLLEIYRRRGDREAYERMRKRFGQRFNAVASEWDSDPEQGRDLQDYPAVLTTLQACWKQPLDAMAELENLLFRKRSGELFELPAYRDVLTLYSVARDLHRLVDQPTPDVDVLLPLASGDELTLTAPPSIFDTLASGNADVDAALADRPTAPVDLDLSEPPAAHESHVGELSPLRVTLRQCY
jgi:hypothetical protein